MVALDGFVPLATEGHQTPKSPHQGGLNSLGLKWHFFEETRASFQRQGTAELPRCGIHWSFFSPQGARLVNDWSLVSSRQQHCVWRVTQGLSENQMARRAALAPSSRARPEPRLRSASGGSLPNGHEEHACPRVPDPWCAT